MLLYQYTNNFLSLDNIVEFTKMIENIKTCADANLEIAGDPILTIASELGDLYLVTTLVESGASVDAVRKSKYAYGNTALIEAARFGFTDVIRYLLSRGASLNCQNYMGNTALMAAVTNRHYEIVSLLLSHGAEVDLPDINNDTALLIACAKGYSDIAELLLQNGADIRHKDNDEEDAFHLARTCNDYKILALLESYK